MDQIKLCRRNSLKFYFYMASTSGQSQNFGKQILCFDCTVHTILFNIVRPQHHSLQPAASQLADMALHDIEYVALKGV